MDFCRKAGAKILQDFL